MRYFDFLVAVLTLPTCSIELGPRESPGHFKTLMLWSSSHFVIFIALWHCGLSC